MNPKPRGRGRERVGFEVAPKLSKTLDPWQITQLLKLSRPVRPGGKPAGLEKLVTLGYVHADYTGVAIYRRTVAGELALINAGAEKKMRLMDAKANEGEPSWSQFMADFGPKKDEPIQRRFKLNDDQMDLIFEVGKGGFVGNSFIRNDLKVLEKRGLMVPQAGDKHEDPSLWMLTERGRMVNASPDMAEMVKRNGSTGFFEDFWHEGQMARSQAFWTNEVRLDGERRFFFENTLGDQWVAHVYETGSARVTAARANWETLVYTGDAAARWGRHYLDDCPHDGFLTPGSGFTGGCHIYPEEARWLASVLTVGAKLYERFQARGG
jgi:hypothetical protein